MTRVVVSEAALRDGALPGICVVTGVPTDHFVEVEVRAVAPWQWMFLPLGVLPWVFARAIATRVLPARLPVEPRRHERIRRHARVTYALGLVAGVVLAASVVFGQPVLAGAGVVLGVVSLVVGTRMRVAWVGAERAGRNGPVILTRVHPHFAHAVGRPLRPRRSANVAAFLAGLALASIVVARVWARSAPSMESAVLPPPASEPQFVPPDAPIDDPWVMGVPAPGRPGLLWLLKVSPIPSSPATEG